MNKPQLKIVYTPVNIEDELPKFEPPYLIRKPDGSVGIKYSEPTDENKIGISWLKEQQLITFTQEEYNKHIRNVIEKTLDNAADKANMLGVTQHNNNAPDVTDEFIYVVDNNGPDYGYTVNKESITNTLEDTFNKLKYE